MEYSRGQIDEVLGTAIRLAGKAVKTLITAPRDIKRGVSSGKLFAGPRAIKRGILKNRADSLKAKTQGIEARDSHRTEVKGLKQAAIASRKTIAADKEKTNRAGKISQIRKLRKKGVQVKGPQFKGKSGRFGTNPL